MPGWEFYFELRVASVRDVKGRLNIFSFLYEGKAPHLILKLPSVRESGRYDLSSDW